ncbi:response regulator [Microbacterium sp.]|uniref:response regulator n=1 Tax=Microbacterium sp. TaxID=51671 RepID=UPI003C73823A
MALARLHGGPLDGQVLSVDDAAQGSLILPYSETQVVYEREGAVANTGEGDGPTSADFRFLEAEDEIDPDADDDDRRNE